VKSRVNKISLIVIFLLIGTVILMSMYVINQNPLKIGGFSANDERSIVIISLINNGNFDIKLDEVKVNNKVPSSTQLVLSYSSQLAMSGEIYSDPLAKFLDIKSSKIHPELLDQEIREALIANTKPISYGLAVTNNEKIKYKYLGIKYEKEVNLDSWLE